MIRLIEDHEVAEINDWFQAHHQQDLPLPLLSPHGYCDEDLTVAAWLEMASTIPAAWIMYLVAKPGIDPKQLIKNLDLLLGGFEEICQANGRPFLFTTAAQPSYIKYLEKRGWSPGHTLMHLCKVL